MSRGFIVRPLAEADLEHAARWYEDERPGLAERFLSDVDRTFARIGERPFQFPALAGEVPRRRIAAAAPEAPGGVAHTRADVEDVLGRARGFVSISGTNRPPNSPRT